MNIKNCWTRTKKRKRLEDLYFLMTNDVEEHSIALNRLDDGTAWRVYREGLPKLLDLYSKYDVEGTF